MTNSEDLAETARNGPSHQDLHCLHQVSGLVYRTESVILLKSLMSIKMRKTNLQEYKVREDLDRIVNSRSWLFTIHTVFVMRRAANILVRLRR